MVVERNLDDPDIPHDDHDGHGQDLTHELDPVVQVEPIIEGTKHHQRRRRHQEPPIGCLQIDRSECRDEDSDGHGQTADARDRRGVNLASARVIDDAESDRQPC